MNVNRHVFVQITGLALLILFAVGLQSFAKIIRDVDSLKGLDSIFVLVESLDDDAKEDGLSEARIKTTVELELQKAGIKVVDLAPAFLWVNIETFKTDFGVYAYAEQLQLIQPATLVFNRYVLLGVPTWRITTVGVVGVKKLKNINIQESLKKFMNDYLKANPKQ